MSRLLLGIAAAGIIVNVVVWVFGQGQATTWRDAWVYDATISAASLSALRAAWTSAGIERRGRLAIAIGMVLWSTGDIIWEVWRHNFGSVPTPSVTDAFYLSMYPMVYVGLLLIVHSRARRPGLSVRIDALVVGLGVATIYSFIITPVARGTTGGIPAIVTEMAYPVGDLLLAVFVVALLAELGWSADRFMILFAVGCVVFSVADSHFLLLNAAGTYQEGTIFDTGWPLGLLLWSLAVHQSEPHASHRQRGTLASLLAPIGVTVTSVVILLVASRIRIPTHVLVLATAALLAVLARMALAFREVADTAEARRQALTDDLTGLPNRRRLAQHISASLTTDEPSPHALLLLGLNHLREICDAFGHGVGDQLLIDVSRRLAAVTNDSQLLVRFSEEEFALWTPVELGGAAPSAFATDLLQALAQPLLVDKVALTVKASVGIAQFPEHALHEVDLLRHADLAMLSARRSGAGFEVCEVAGLDAGRRQIMLTEELREAIESDQLICQYQPKMEIITGRIVGVEALVRWRHPGGNLLGPADFLLIATEAGLLSGLSRRVLSVAIAEGAEWARRGIHIKTSVNLNVTDLLDESLVRFVSQLLYQHGMAATSLMVEVTEETFMREPEQVRRQLVALHELGIGLSIDDYGSGYSSLAYLRTIPADEIKLDRMFVEGVASSAVDQSIVAATVVLAHSLGLSLVVEGVESQADLTMLASLGCDIAQGYYLSPPLTAKHLEEWLTSTYAVDHARAVPTSVRTAGAGD